MDNSTCEALKERFQDKLGFLIEPNAEELIRSLSNVEPNEHLEYGITESQANQLGSLRSGLVLLRSIDIWTTRRGTVDSIGDSLPAKILNSGMDNITASDVLHSIFSLPCLCQLNKRCWKHIKTNDLRYVIVFPSDLQFLYSHNIRTITDINKFPAAEELQQDHVNKMWQNVMQSINMPSSEKYELFLSRLTLKKIDIWKTSSKEIAMPLMNLFKDDFFPNTASGLATPS